MGHAVSAGQTAPPALEGLPDGQRRRPAHSDPPPGRPRSHRPPTAAARLCMFAGPATPPVVGGYTSAVVGDLHQQFVADAGLDGQRSRSGVPGVTDGLGGDRLGVVGQGGVDDGHRAGHPAPWSRWRPSVSSATRRWMRWRRSTAAPSSAAGRRWSTGCRRWWPAGRRWSRVSRSAICGERTRAPRCPAGPFRRRTTSGSRGRAGPARCVRGRQAGSAQAPLSGGSHRQRHRCMVGEVAHQVSWAALNGGWSRWATASTPITASPRATASRWPALTGVGERPGSGARNDSVISTGFGAEHLTAGRAGHRDALAQYGVGMQSRSDRHEQRARLIDRRIQVVEVSDRLLGAGRRTGPGRRPVAAAVDFGARAGQQRW